MRGLIEGSTVGLVTDSVSQIPTSLAQRLGVTVVPALVSLNGVSYREGLELSADDYWYRSASQPDLTVSTSQPSPGDLAEAYSVLAEAGATSIVSVHVGQDYSGTLNSARIAADQVDVDVHIVDSQNASFGITGCVWSAADSRAAGDPAAVVAVKARAAAGSIGTTFILDGLEQARAAGRVDNLEDRAKSKPGATAVFAGYGAALDVVGEAGSVDELCQLMAAQFCGRGLVRVGISLADPLTRVYSTGIERLLSGQPEVVEIIHYRVGPSVAAYTGPGTAGGYWFPA